MRYKHFLNLARFCYHQQYHSFFFFSSLFMLPSSFGLQLTDSMWPLFLREDTTRGAWNNVRIGSFTGERINLQTSILFLRAVVTSYLTFWMIQSKQSPLNLRLYATVSWIIMFHDSRTASFTSYKNEMVAKSSRANSW